MNKYLLRGGRSVCFIHAHICMRVLGVVHIRAHIHTHTPKGTASGCASDVDRCLGTEFNQINVVLPCVGRSGLLVSIFISFGVFFLSSYLPSTF